MRIPDPSGLAFLFFLLVFLPVMARRSARRAETADTDTISTAKTWTSTLVTQGVLFALALVVGRTFGFAMFAVPHLGARELLAAVAAIAVQFAIRWAARLMHTEQELRDKVLLRWFPKNGGEWSLFLAALLAASIAEEAAYRGVGMAILWWSTGSWLVSALACSLAFALAHAVQGGKSMAGIFLLALSMHVLVWYTETLVIAMAVHAIYDVAVSLLKKREMDSWAS